MILCGEVLEAAPTAARPITPSDQAWERVTYVPAVGGVDNTRPVTLSRRQSSRCSAAQAECPVITALAQRPHCGRSRYELLSAKPGRVDGLSMPVADVAGRLDHAAASQNPQWRRRAFSS